MQEGEPMQRRPLATTTRVRSARAALTVVLAASLFPALSACSGADRAAVMDKAQSGRAPVSSVAPSPVRASGVDPGTSGSTTAPTTRPADVVTRTGDASAVPDVPPTTPAPPSVAPRTGRETPARPPSDAPVSGPYLIECVDDNLAKAPASFTLACADANESLDGLSWQNWGAPTAKAKGYIVVNTCEPNCAEGSLKRYPVSVLASRLVRHGPGQVYTRLTLRFLGAIPEAYLRVEEYELPS
jgi:hypothetical protein